MDLSAQYEIGETIVWLIFFWGLYRLYKKKSK
jgi:hypothetical protein